MMRFSYYFIFVVILSKVSSRHVPSIQEKIHGSRINRNFISNSKSHFQIIETGENLLDTRCKRHIEECATQFVSTTLGVDEDEIEVSSHHTSEHNTVTHIYFQQKINGLKVFNGVANLNIFNNTQIVSFGHSFYTGVKAAVVDGTSELKYNADDAVLSLEIFLGYNNSNEKLSTVVSDSTSSKTTIVVKGSSLTNNDIPAALNYIVTDEEGKNLALVWNIEVAMKWNHYVACVETSTCKVISLIDYVSEATYNVLPLGVLDPSVGDRKIITNPEHPIASKNGWHEQGTKTERFNLTIGNNVIAQENHEGKDNYIANRRPTGGENLVFNFTANFNDDPIKFEEASVTQLFYMCNIMHDIFYLYGFNEVAGNFQDYNYGLGGDSGDAVVAQAQYGGGYNGAAFLTLPDGLNGRIMMAIFDWSGKLRDSVFDSAIVIHEYMHGISQRLTGGRMNTGCLVGRISGGLGEGWSDFFAVILQLNETSTPNDVHQIGVYAGGRPIRIYPYSSDMSINPLTYKHILNDRFILMTGTIWATILYEVYLKMVGKHGFDKDWYNTNPIYNPSGFKGNIIFTQLVIDAMKLQPCMPNFVQARDTILQADVLNNNGENLRELWIGFAKRGLGIHANSDGKESFETPTTVSKLKSNSTDIFRSNRNRMRLVPMMNSSS